MSRVHDKKVERGEPAAAEPGSGTPGKVVVDSRGHSVWQWAKDVIESWRATGRAPAAVLARRLAESAVVIDGGTATDVPAAAPPEAAA